MKRYDLEKEPGHNTGGRMEERTDGEWVRWEDVEDLPGLGRANMEEYARLDRKLACAEGDLARARAALAEGAEMLRMTTESCRYGSGLDEAAAEWVEAWSAR